ncbi:odorant receptor 266 isoform X1 [Nasonia vitripennis]|uniref:Odorant receptor n=1 Tax=Nasonia vitripennis TaxID=7425 RepID=A0A7M7IPV7_NASVI|nr:odorant receptor 266 isoform X1 [Nasonia vitripennis]
MQIPAVRGPATIGLVRISASVLIQGDSPSVTPAFEDYTKLNSLLFRCMGMGIGTDGNKRDKRSQIIERVPTVLINIICLLDFVYQMQWINDIWKTDKKFVLQILTNALSNFVCLCKGFRLVYNREDLQTLFEDMAVIWRRRMPRHEIRNEISREAQKTLVFCRFYVIMILFLSLSFCLPPLKYFILQFTDRNANRTYDYTERIFFVRYPFEVNNLKVYNFLFIQELWVLYAAALHWMCCDTLFVQLTSHTSLQFKILHYDTETSDNTKDERQSRKNIVDIIRRHQELLRICDAIEDVFSPIIFIIMLLSAITMCVNLFELQEMFLEAQYAGIALQSFHFMSVFFQLLVYCDYAETLTEQAGSIAEAVYNSKWTENGHVLRMNLQMCIMKSQKPFYCTAYGFFPIDHQRITTILKTAMSYYMMLYQTTS